MYEPSSALHGLEAVTAAHPENHAILALKSIATDAKYDRAELTLTVPREQIVDACAALKYAGYNFFETVTAVDWLPSEPRFAVTYHLLSHTLKQRIRVVAWLHSSDASIDTIIPVWPAANFYEREILDLFGIHIGGHPNLTRIMMPEDWQGHPLRKDYPVEGYR